MAVKSADETRALLERAAGHHRTGNLPAAEKDYRAVLKRRPRDPDALHLLGIVCEQRGARDEAIRLIDQAIAAKSDFAEAHFNRARIAHSAGDFATAETHLRRGLALKPTNIAEHFNLATLLLDQDRMVDAVACLKDIVARHPQSVEAHVRLGRACRRANDPDGMLAAASAGLKLDPNHAVLHLLASEAHFDRGELKEGWQDYRWRFQSTENRVVGKSYPLPVWQGEDLAERRLLVWTEQGPGDEILYGNMLGDLAARSKQCGLQCSPRLAPLFKRAFPNVTVFGRDLSADELKAFDMQTSIASAGEWLRTDFASFPHNNGYLKADDTLRASLRARYESAAPGNCIVGIAWRSSGVENAATKTVSLLDWGPILQIPGMTFVNLQYGDCAAELEAVAKGFGTQVIHDPTIDPLKDMDAYAAQVASMDVVISSSNTAAHVAGALGIPVFCMLPQSLGHGRRWWWFPREPLCPWYPSLRRFFQSRQNEWLDVIRDAGLALLDVGVAKGAVVKPGPYLRVMGKAFADIGKTEHAEHLYRRLGQEPGLQAESLFLLAGLRKGAGKFDEALQLYDQAIAAKPDLWQALNARGVLLAAALRFDEAIASYEAALTHAPQSFEVRNNLGNALRRSGRGEEALAQFEEAQRLKPGFASVELNLAGTLDELDRSDDALSVFDRMATARPDDVDVRYNRAQALLLTGRFAEGWAEFPWRLKRAAANVRYEHFRPPVWQGEDLTGRNVLVWTEQGIGDEILTASMLPDAIAAAKRVTFVCSERLIPLMRRSFPAAKVVVRKEPLPPEALDPRIDFQMSQSELGLAFRRDWSAFPNRPHFLKADPSAQAALHRKYQALRPGARLVGISWRSSNYEVGWLKGPGLAAWRSLLTTPGEVAFVNLQYGDCREELKDVAAKLGVDVIHDPDVDPLKDMDLFAAQVGAMDLVISTSNTTVHTAGGLGVPTWVLLPRGRGRMWYWFRDREDSPWYPSLRLLRPKSGDDWTSRDERCAGELARWLKGQTAGQA